MRISKSRHEGIKLESIPREFPLAEDIRVRHRSNIDSAVMDNPPEEDALSLGRHFRDLHSIAERDFNAALAIYNSLWEAYLQERWVVLKATEVNKGLFMQNKRLVELLAQQAKGDKVASIIIERLSDLASKDQLTGLLNRRGFEQVVEESQREGISGVLVMVDLDKFKEVNDSFGHPVGDLAFMSAANYLNEIAGSVGVVTKMRSSKVLGPKRARRHTPKRETDDQPKSGRLGGEELAIFIPNMTARELETILKQKSGSSDFARIRAPLGFKFSETPLLPGKDRPNRPDDYVSFSGGIIDLKPNVPLFEALAKIDQTLYRAKEGGRDRILIVE